ncbi:protein kinase [Streptomyces sp. CC219B]|uniref:protein kinase domain-containing protein n=1 Tax=Streptomyces sp. CC219B TaxID=3044574 RepID=UPI0024A883EC|nr:protein kinase [Streptomyces sp. CC219B]
MGSPLTRDDPERIGGYWLAARLGAGGQGVVYEAYDASGARYALKTLHREAGDFLRDRFAREAEAAQRVAAFCTARIVHAGIDGDVPYLVSEYVPGPTLAAEVGAKGPLDQDALLRLATGAATALAAIHQAGVVHRDLKPGNVLLGPDGPRIIDFGIARAPDMSLTATGAIMGTFGYMAPEVLSGQRATEASDVFAWAAVVLYAATATEPFRGENIAEVAHRTATVDPDLAALPPEIRPLMAAALAKEPQHRPTANDLLLGLVGAPVPSTDPRAALMEAGARKAAGPAAADSDGAPGAGAGHTAVEAPPGKRPEAAPTEASPGKHPEAALSEAPPGERAEAAALSEAPPTKRPEAAFAEAPLGERAEAAFTALAPAAQLAAHELLLRLTVPGSATDGSQDSVRTAEPAELLADRPESERNAVTAAVQGLAAAGVLLTDADGSVRPASAALLPAWRRLRAWTDADRPGIARLQRLGAAARLWRAHGERPEDLLRGTELRDGLDWLPTAPYHLRPNPLEQRFLAAGRTAAARTTRRRRQLLAGLAGTTVLALLAGGVAWTQNREAERRRAQATARAVAHAAESLAGTEPATAQLLGLASWRIAGVPEARAALTAAAVQPELAVIDLPALNDGQQRGSALSPDGRRLITYSTQAVRTWDLADGRAGAKKPLMTLSSEDFELGTDSQLPEFSPDGRLVLLSGKDKSVRPVNVEDGAPAAPPMTLPGYRSWSGISNQGHVLMSKGWNRGESLTLFDRSGREVVSWKAQASRHAVSPDGEYVAECRGDTLVVGAVRSLTQPVVIEADVIDRLDGCRFRFSPDGRYLAVESGDSSHVYDLAHRKKTGQLHHEGSTLRFSSGGRFLVGWSPDLDVVEVWDRTRTDAPLFEVALPTGRTEKDGSGRPPRVALDEETQRLRYVADSTGQFYEIDLAGALDRRGDDPVTAAISADGRFAVLRPEAVEHPPLHVVDLRTGERVGSPVTQRTIDGADPDTDRFSAVDDEGRVLAYSYSKGYTRGPENQERQVIVRDVRRGKDIHRIPVRAHHHVLHLAVSPDGRHLSMTRDVFLGASQGCSLEIWDLGRRKRIRQLDGGGCGHGTFSRDSRRLLTTTGVEVDLATGDVRDDVLGPSPNTDLAFSPDGRFTAVLKASGWVELWDGAVRDRAALIPSGLVPGAARFGERLGAMAFSDDASLLAVAVNDDAVQLWDTEAKLPLGEPLTFTGHRIEALSFDGTTLRTVTGGRRHALDLTPEKLAEAVCRRVGRDITRQEWQTYVPDAPYRELC